MTHFIHIKPRYPMKTQYQDLDCVMSFFNFPLITQNMVSALIGLPFRIKMSFNRLNK